MKWLYKKPSVVYFWMRIHKSNSCFPWNRNNVIRAISNNYCEVGCNSFADFPLLSRYSDVSPNFLATLSKSSGMPAFITTWQNSCIAVCTSRFFLHKIIIFPGILTDHKWLHSVSQLHFIHNQILISVPQAGLPSIQVEISHLV